MGFFLREMVASEKRSARPCTRDTLSENQLPAGCPLDEARWQLLPFSSPLATPPGMGLAVPCTRVCRQRRATGCFRRASNGKEWKQVEQQEGKKEFRGYSKYKKQKTTLKSLISSVRPDIRSKTRPGANCYFLFGTS